jgi:hypothetical protein
MHTFQHGSTVRPGRIARLILAAICALTLAGCGTLGCGGAANNRTAGGTCSTHIPFLR